MEITITDAQLWNVLLTLLICLPVLFVGAGFIAWLKSKTPSAKKERKTAMGIWNKLKENDFDLSTLTPVELDFLRELMPVQYTSLIVKWKEENGGE